jgi:hypothetical protein
MEREYYTRHGLHLNGKGKEIMTKKILTEIRTRNNWVADKKKRNYSPDMEKYLT